jgi:transcriptional regulator with XRE-family HTH domain
MSIENIKPQFSVKLQPQFNAFALGSLTMDTLAKRVAEAINNSGKDIPQIAKACGISVQAVYKWINGLSMKISGEHLVELARETNYEARWIISGKGEKRKDPKAIAVTQAMQNMPEYKKDVLVQTSSALAKPDEGTNGKQ